MSKNIVITLPDDVVRHLSLRARRYGKSRRALISSVLTLYVRAEGAAEPAETIEGDVARMFRTAADAEAPAYGERCRRHFNKKGDGNV